MRQSAAGGGGRRLGERAATRQARVAGNDSAVHRQTGSTVISRQIAEDRAESEEAGGATLQSTGSTVISRQIAEDRAEAEEAGGATLESTVQ
jgi:hypothetical protein